MKETFFQQVYADRWAKNRNIFKNSWKKIFVLSNLKEKSKNIFTYLNIGTVPLVIGQFGHDFSRRI